MKAQELSRQYATAVFSLLLEDWLISMRVVKDNLIGDPALFKKLQEANQPFQDKQKLLDEIIPPNSPPKIHNFFYTLLKEERFGLLSDILADLERMSFGGPHVQVAYVTTAIALSDEEKEQFRRKLRVQYNKELEFVFNVDLAIIGGAIVQTGDKRIDGSVATRLEAMSNALGLK